MSTTIGSKIKEIREANGMTQEELANKLGYKSKSTINKIEMGINDITQSKISAFANALNVPPSHLMGWTDGIVDSQKERHIYDLNTLFNNNDNAKYLFKFLSNIFKHERIAKDLTEKNIANKAEIPIEDYIFMELPDAVIEVKKIEKVLGVYNLNFYYMYGLLSALNGVLTSIDNQKDIYEDADSEKNNIVDKMISGLNNKVNNM